MPIPSNDFRFGGCCCLEALDDVDLSVERDRTDAPPLLLEDRPMLLLALEDRPPLLLALEDRDTLARDPVLVEELLDPAQDRSSDNFEPVRED